MFNILEAFAIVLAVFLTGILVLLLIGAVLYALGRYDVLDLPGHILTELRKPKVGTVVRLKTSSFLFYDLPKGGVSPAAGDVGVVIDHGQWGDIFVTLRLFSQPDHEIETSHKNVEKVNG